MKRDGDLLRFVYPFRHRDLVPQGLFILVKLPTVLGRQLVATAVAKSGAALTVYVTAVASVIEARQVEARCNRVAWCSRRNEDRIERELILSGAVLCMKAAQ